MKSILQGIVIWALVIWDDTAAFVKAHPITVLTHTGTLIAGLIIGLLF